MSVYLSIYLSIYLTKACLKILFCRSHQFTQILPLNLVFYVNHMPANIDKKKIVYCKMIFLKGNILNCFEL